MWEDFVFMAQENARKVHQSELPAPPTNWQEVQEHAFKEEWIKAAQLAFDPDQTLTLTNDNVQTLRLVARDAPVIHTRLRHVDIQGSSSSVKEFIIPLKWMFTCISLTQTAF